MTILKDVFVSRKSFLPKPKGNTARALLGKYKDLLPRGQSSTALIRKDRNTLYGRTK